MNKPALVTLTHMMTSDNTLSNGKVVCNVDVLDLESLRILMEKAVCNVDVLDLKNPGILIGNIVNVDVLDLENLGILIRKVILDHEKGQDLAPNR